MAASATPTALKYASLAVLCLQNSFLAILMRLSRVGDYPKFNTSTAVFMGEVFKLVTCIAIIAKVRPCLSCAHSVKDLRRMHGLWSPFLPVHLLLRGLHRLHLHPSTWRSACTQTRCRLSLTSESFSA